MTDHKWKTDADGAESCEREGCTVRHNGLAGLGIWQRKKGAHWRRETREPLPPCAGKEAGEPPSAPCRVCGEVNQHKMSCRPANRRDAALAETAPSPLEVMRKAMESIKAFSPFAVDVRRAETALSALATLEESIRKDAAEKACDAVHKAMMLGRDRWAVSNAVDKAIITRK